MKISTHVELDVYRRSFDAAMQIFELSKSFPRDEKFALTDQIRRASRSVSANLAEAWRKRRYEKAFISKLSDADGEQQETQHWIEIALDCQYLSKDQSTRLLNQCKEIGKLIGGMMAKSEQFCQRERLLREPLADYFI